MQRKYFFAPLFIILSVLFFSGSLYAGWNIETIPVSISGYSHSMKLDASGMPHISGITSSGTAALLHVQKNSSGWVSETVFQRTGGIYPTWPVSPTAIDIDSQGYPHIMDVYQHFSGGVGGAYYPSLKYLYKNSSGWHTVSLTAGSFYLCDGYCHCNSYCTSNNPFSMSFKIDSNGNLHAAVFDELYDINLYDLPDVFHGGLHYWFAGADTWLISGSYVGSYNSIALDASGYPHISYYDGTNLDLRYIYQDGTGWHDELVDSTGDVGKYTSIRIDSNNNPHISYFDATNGALKYAYKDSAWHIETVDSGGNAGLYSTCSSLALDSSGNPHISYYDAANTHLKYAQKDGTGWHIETVDSSAGVGANSCIDLDSSNRPHITYAGGGGVKYAVYENQTNTTTSQLPVTTTTAPSTTTTVPPTVINLSRFIATPSSHGVVLNWSTESETDNAGFNIYRSEAENGQYTKINESLIPAKGSSTQGTSYEFIDTNVQNRKTYYYKLEDIDLNGTATMHGPVSATPRLIYGIGK